MSAMNYPATMNKAMTAIDAAITSRQRLWRRMSVRERLVACCVGMFLGGANGWLIYRLPAGWAVLAVSALMAYAYAYERALRRRYAAITEARQQSEG
ncbi:hypothetical protein [Candidatus Poriferisodalis sp.]|uniref:hypothetical protein n=1 Tax=Candidatus Poriferisodalis sp. TaxID=3101277 RepID=UPI003B012A74